MPEAFVCPHCSGAIDVKAGHTDPVVRCSFCNNTVAVPERMLAKPPAAPTQININITTSHPSAPSYEPVKSQPERPAEPIIRKPASLNQTSSESAHPITVFIVVLLFSLICGIILTNTPNATPTFAPTATTFNPPASLPRGDTILSVRTSEWPAYNDEITDDQGRYLGTITTGPLTGRHLITLTSKLNLALQVNASGKNLTDTVIDAPFYIQECPSGGAFGLIVRGNPQQTNAYIFLLECSGNWRFWPKIESDSGDILTSGTVERPRHRTSINMTIVVTGNKFSLYIANQPVGEVEDSTFTSGETGVYFEQIGSGKLRIAITNLYARQIASDENLPTNSPTSAP